MNLMDVYRRHFGDDEMVGFDHPNMKDFINEVNNIRLPEKKVEYKKLSDFPKQQTETAQCSVCKKTFEARLPNLIGSDHDTFTLQLADKEPERIFICSRCWCNLTRQLGV